MAHVLAVPIRLDALRLSTPLSVVEAKVDFTRMPYWDGEREVNPDVAHISEDLVSHPFQDRALVLPRGVHLHWTLPDALTRGSSRTTEENGRQVRRMLFPAAPNRWLVTRSVDGESQRSWFVESDYLYPDKHEFSEADAKLLRSVAVPFPCDRTKGERPFRYLGRAHDLSQPAKPGSGEYLSTKGYRLTAVGYQADPAPAPTPDAHEMLRVVPLGGLGEPTFAALYPNCLSVFGLHDSEPPSENVKGVRYEVIGWYSKPDHDCLAAPAFLEAATNARKEFEKQKKTPSDAEVTTAALKEAYGWDVEGTLANLPDRTIFHASIKMDVEPIIADWTPKVSVASGGTGNGALSDEDSRTDASAPKVTVAMGNTVTEALSAYLANAKVPGLEMRPLNLEEQLEALHLADRIDHLTLDIGPKFQHARHDRGFSSVSGGTIWTIRVPNRKELPLTPLQTPEAAWKNAEDVAHALNQLNIAQRNYDQCVDELDSVQKQLFADWYKYMLCAYPPDDARDDYPDIDEVRYFIEKNDLEAIENKRADCDKAGQVRDSLRVELERLLKEKLQSVYVLQSRPDLRYYRPHEPVLLIAGEGLRVTPRHGQGELLLCTVPTQTVDFAELETGRFNSFDNIRGELHRGVNADAPGTWHPFSLDWRVEMQPLQKDNNLSADKRAYDPRFILENYELAGDEVDLTLKPGAGAVNPAASVYTGSSLITAHARLKLKERINAFLSRRLLQKYYEKNGIELKYRTEDYFEKYVSYIKTWYDENRTDKTVGDPMVDAMLQVAGVIDGEGFHVLAQSLNGFNEALLMHKQTFQLPLAEPLGFDDAQDFTARVKAAVGPNTYVAPQPLDDFQPIRTGGFKVLALRLVDTFGRVHDLRVNRWLAAKVMPESGEPGFFSLPPRLVQPARLSFQWLSGSASGDEVEMNSHPATTPICGWLLPNHLDNSLMVYDVKGRAQGSVTQEGRWLYAPGAEKVEPEVLPVHLRNLVAHLIKKSGGLPQFFEDLETALEKINPASSSQHDALSLLMGRPVAVVRARLRLELRGSPAINQSWDAFRSDVARCLQDEEAGRVEKLVRKSDGVTAVKFPVRLGDSRQLNDGLLGYWVENRAGDTYTTFHSGNESLIELAADDGDVTLTMLLDPRGVVHLTSGILPAEALEIPQDQYAAAMQAMEVTFLTSPVLSPAGGIGLPLPTETGHAWSWVARGKNTGGEGEWLKPARVGPAATQASWGEAPEIHEGWLRLTNSGE